MLINVNSIAGMKREGETANEVVPKHDAAERKMSVTKTFHLLHDGRKVYVTTSFPLNMLSLYFEIKPNMNFLIKTGN